MAPSAVEHSSSRERGSWARPERRVNAVFALDSCRNAQRLRVLLVAAALSFHGWQARTAEPARPKVDFARQIRPILAENCFECHGPDPRGRKGDLRLDIREACSPTAAAIAVVVPNRPEESELISRITAESPG